MNALKLIVFLKTQYSKKTKQDNLTLNQLKTKADKDIQKNGLDIQAKHEILLQSLQKEAIVLTKILKELE